MPTPKRGRKNKEEEEEKEEQVVEMTPRRSRRLAKIQKDSSSEEEEEKEEEEEEEEDFDVSSEEEEEEEEEEEDLFENLTLKDDDENDDEDDEPLTQAQETLETNPFVVDENDPRRELLRFPMKEAAYGPNAVFYESESEEELDGDANTVGNVPMEWYRHYDHIGYNIFGQKLLKSEEADRIDRFLSRADDPAYWRTVRDELNARDVTITERELDLIRAMQRNRFPTGYDPYEQPPVIDDPALKIHGVTNVPEPKRRFVPSKHERLRIRRLVLALRSGQLDPNQHTFLPEDPDALDRPTYYDLWAEESTKHAPHLQLRAPKVRLPGHAESYRPPEEYLFNDSERKRWESLEPEERHLSFIPQRHERMRDLSIFDAGMKERFERLLDLYLAPRVARKRNFIPKESLLPRLPKPQDLRPFPTTIGVQYLGHTNRVRSVSVHRSGRWLATAADDGTVRVWEVVTGRCLKVLRFGFVVTQAVWSPNPNVTVLAVIVDDQLFFVNAGVGLPAQDAATDALLTLPNLNAAAADANATPGSAVAEAAKANARQAREKSEKLAAWTAVDAADAAKYAAELEEKAEKREAKRAADLAAGKEVRVHELTGKRTVKPCLGARLRVAHPMPIKEIVWHHKGDYCATVTPNSAVRTVMIHQLSTGRTQAPFLRSKGDVECVTFHPTKPHFLLATKTHVRIFNLVRQKMTQKLATQAKYVSSVDVHPRGDNVLVSTYDRRLAWFDLELSSRPYKSLRYHSEAIRKARFHRRFPLFASASDDCTLHVFHGMPYEDWSKNALIVPLKVLRGGHKPSSDKLGVLDITWHPQQPWLFSAGADHVVNLWSS